MKICISSTGKDLSALVDQRFGRCPHFIVVDTETKDVQVLSNVSAQATRGAGVGAAQLVVDQGCQVVITGNMGPNALRVLQASGIRILAAGAISGEEALRQFNEEKLLPITQARGGGCGFGRGGGRGGGRRWP